MPKFLFVVFTEPVEGQEDAYNDWYDNQHLSDTLNVDGVTAAHRYELVRSHRSQEPLPGYLALYEIEAEDVADVPRSIAAAREAGKMPVSPALDEGKISSAFYRPITSSAADAKTATEAA